MPENDYEVQTIEEDFRVNPRGELVRVMLVNFMVGENGPFTEEFRPEEFTPDEVRSRLTKRAQTIKEIAS